MKAILVRNGIGAWADKTARILTRGLYFSPGIFNIVDRMVQMQVIRSEVTQVGQVKAQGITLGQVRTQDVTF